MIRQYKHFELKTRMQSRGTITARLLLVGLFLTLGACLSSDQGAGGSDWPDLSDITAAPAGAAGAKEHEAIIEALRKEARSRKSEGYQAPEASSDTDNTGESN